MYLVNRTLYIDDRLIGTAKPSSNSKFLLYNVILSKETYPVLTKHLDVFVNKDEIEKALKLYETVKERTELIEFTFPIKVNDITSFFSYLSTNVRGISMRIDRNEILLTDRDGVLEQKYGVVKLKALFPEKFFNKEIQEKFNRLSDLLGVEITELGFKGKSIVDIGFKSPVVFTKNKIKSLKEVKDLFDDKIKSYLERISDKFEIVCRYYTSLVSFTLDLESLTDFNNPVYYIIEKKFNTVYVSTKIPKDQFESLTSLNLKKYRVVLFDPETQKSRSINLEKVNYENLNKVKI